MTRYLPIIMLALGLVMLSGSFAAAATHDAAAQSDAEWCVPDEPSAESVSTLDPPAQTMGRCWKKMGLGVLVTGCKVQALLPARCGAPHQSDRPHFAIVQPAIGLTDVQPLLDLPPPKA